jgi:hypothetical protein
LWRFTNESPRCSSRFVDDAADCRGELLTAESSRRALGRRQVERQPFYSRQSFGERFRDASSTSTPVIPIEHCLSGAARRECHHRPPAGLGLDGDDAKSSSPGSMTSAALRYASRTASFALKSEKFNFRALARALQSGRSGPGR